MGQRRKALVIGINNYQNDQANLRACVNDARSMEKMLTRHNDQSTNFETKTITSDMELVTHDLLMPHIRELFLSDKDTDIALLYFSGHGSRKDGELRLCTADYLTDRKSILLSEIMDMIAESNIKEIILILDCCYSGGTGNLPGVEIPIAQLRKGVTILAASTAKDEAEEWATEGKFTHFLVRGLKGSAKDLFGHVTTASLYAFTASYFNLWEQKPVFKGYFNDLTTLRKCEPELAEKHLKKILRYFPAAEGEFDLENPTCEEIKDLKRLSKFGYVVGKHGKSIRKEVKRDGTCHLTQAGKDLHLLFTKQK